MKEEKLFDFLKGLGIATKTLRHSPVFTVEEAQAVRHTQGQAMVGGHAKSLFLRDKKKRRALVVVREDHKVDLKSLAEQIGLGRVSFASPNSLLDMLGVTPGSVTPFALINAQQPKSEDPAISVILDKALLAQTPLWFHPLQNAATTSITPGDLIHFIKACGYEPKILEII